MYAPKYSPNPYRIDFDLGHFCGQVFCLTDMPCIARRLRDFMVPASRTPASGLAGASVAACMRVVECCYERDGTDVSVLPDCVRPVSESGGRMQINRLASHDACQAELQRCMQVIPFLSVLRLQLDEGHREYSQYSLKLLPVARTTNPC